MSEPMTYRSATPIQVATIVSQCYTFDDDKEEFLWVKACSEAYALAVKRAPDEASALAWAKTHADHMLAEVKQLAAWEKEI